MLDEPSYFTGGQAPVQTFELDGSRMGVLICYDLRFPELARTLSLKEIDVLFIVAEWPAARASHWEILLQARAIENQCFVVSCNRVGAYNGVDFAGRSMIIDLGGRCLPKGLLTRKKPSQPILSFRT